MTTNEAIEELESGTPVVLSCNGFDYYIDISDNFIGGDVEDGYISEVLGNIIHSSARVVVEKSIKHLTEDSSEVTISI